MPKWVVGAIAAAVAVGAFAYLAHEILAIRAEYEGKGDAEILKDRLRPEARKPTGLARILEDGRIFLAMPGDGCSEAARTLVDEAVRHQFDGLALGAARRALEQDPGCAAAGRIGAEMARQSLGLSAFRKEANARAKAAPSDAGIQLVAAYAAGADEDGPGMRTYLERAQAADPAAPLLFHAWGAYYRDLADPVELGHAIESYDEEVRRTGDLGSLYCEQQILASIDDFRPALKICERLASAGHGLDFSGIPFGCSDRALRLGDPSAAIWLDRVEQVRDPGLSESCKHADFGHILLANGKYEEALAAAQRGSGCEQVAQAVERRALLALGRYQEAAAVPYDTFELEQDGFPRALALALSGRSQEALDVLTPAGASDRPAWNLKVLRLLIERGATNEELKALVPRGTTWGPAEVEARAGCGRLRAGLVDEAIPFLDRALAMDPRSSPANACRVYQLSLQGRLTEAAAAGEAAIAGGVEGIQANLGFVYLELHQCEKAVPLLEDQVRKNPLNSAAWGNLYKCLSDLGRDDRAKEIEPYLAAGRIGLNPWLIVGLAFLVAPLYLVGKLLLRTLLPGRFGHLRFP